MNQQQNEIISDNKFITNRQALCVVACAGSGKTTTIINKIEYMINNLDCKSDDFIICTFTNNAVNDIINRIKIKDLNISTFHSIGLKELIKYKYKIIPNIPEPIPEEYLIKYLELINTPSYIYRFKYIFIDEYQDINQLQYEIIKKWYEHCKLLLVVGDDQQNIYTFRNTSIKYILNFPNDFGGEYKYLSINYRSNKGIVDLSNAIIKFNIDRIDKTIIAASNDIIIRPKIRFFSNQTDEYKYIIKYINKITTNESIAILCRTNKKLYKIENYLYVNNIKLDHYNIRLLTIHGSKGLEFDNVLLTNYIDTNIDTNTNTDNLDNTDNSDNSNNSDIQEERRLFYVACTRSKKRLLITSIWYDIYQPSRFIYELYKSNIDLINIINFKWDTISSKSSISSKSNKSNKSNISNLLYNLDINTYINLQNKSLLPTLDDQIFKIMNVHLLLDIDINIKSFIQLYIQRIIYELLDVDNYIYLEYVLNEFNFKNHSKILKLNINKYLEDISDDELLISSIEYIRLNSYIDIKINSKDLITIKDNLSYNNKLNFDINMISIKNKTILSNSYREFQNKKLKSIDIINSIYNLSLCADFIQGKYSMQSEFNKKINIINPINLNIINNYLSDIISNATYINYNYYICIDNYLIKRIDLILDNRMIIINMNKPSINEYIIYLLMITKYNIDNQSINKLNSIQLYNPIDGTIIEWNIVDYVYMDLYNYLTS
jgi:hypothetical protein